MKRMNCGGAGGSRSNRYHAAFVTVLAVVFSVTGSTRGQTGAGRPGDSGGAAPSPELARAIHEARQASESGDWARAERLCADVLKQAPGVEDVRFRRGMALVKLNRTREAVEEFDTLLGPDPDPAGLAAVGRVLHGEGGRGGPQATVARPYLERALELAVRRGDSRSPDFETATLVASLAAELGRDDALGEAAGTLQRHHPEKMETHYFAGAAAARRRDWVTAEDELLRAGELGLPRAELDAILSEGLHARAAPWRYARYTIYAVGAVALGLLGLFVAGKALSSLTLRSAQKGDPNAAITPGQRRLRRAYRVVINLAGLYYYICVPVVIALALLVVLAVGYGVLSLPRVPAKALALVFMFGAATLMMIWSSLRSLFVRLEDGDPGRALGVDEAPALWALTREVAAQVGTRPVDEIWMTAGTELAVFERGGWWKKFRDRGRRALILGSEVLHGFRLDAFRAVLAHEYGHFVHRDTAGGDVALRVNATMGRFAQALLQQGNVQWWNIGWQFLRLYHFLFRRITHGASRLQEINADRVAARLYGPSAFEEGLRHVIRRDIGRQSEATLAFHRYRFAPATDATAGAPEPATPGEDPSTRYIRAEFRRQAEAQLATTWEAGTTEEDTHPQPAERIRLISRVKPARPGPGGDGERPDSEGTVEDLFSDPDGLRAERDQELSKAVTAFVQSRRDEFREFIRQLDAYIAEHPGLTEPLVQRGLVHMELREFEEAAADFAEALRHGTPQVDVCHYQRALARAELGDIPGAEDDLLRGAERNSEQEAGVRSEVGDVHLKAGRLEAALDQYDRAVSLRPLDPYLYLRRGDVHALRGDHAAAGADYTRTLELDPHCAEALAGRALARSALGRIAEASADARQALSIEPTHLSEALTLTSLAGTG